MKYHRQIKHAASAITLVLQHDHHHGQLYAIIISRDEPVHETGNQQDCWIGYDMIRMQNDIAIKLIEYIYENTGKKI